MLQQPRSASDAPALLLFTAGNVQGNELHWPVWVYRDHHGSLQGPFSAANMLQWYSLRRLPPDLLLCGITPQSAILPLDAIPIRFFQPLSHLINATATGRQYSPLSLNNASAQTMTFPQIQAMPGTLHQAATPQQSTTSINAGAQMRLQQLKAIGGIIPGQSVIAANVPNAAAAQLRAGGPLIRQGMAGSAGASQQLMELAPIQQQATVQQQQRQPPKVVLLQQDAQSNQPPADLLRMAASSNMPAAAGRQVVVMQPQQAQQAPVQPVPVCQGQTLMQPMAQQQQQQQRPSQHVVLQQLAARLQQANVAPVQGVQGVLQPPAAGQQRQLAVQQQVQAGIGTASLTALMQDARNAQQRQQMALTAVKDQNKQATAAEVVQQRLQHLPAAAARAGGAAAGSAAHLLQRLGQLAAVADVVPAMSTVMAALPTAGTVVPQPQILSSGHSAASIVSLSQGLLQGPLPAAAGALHAAARGPVSAANTAVNIPRTSSSIASSSMNNLQQLVKQATAMSDRPAAQGTVVSMPSTGPIAATTLTAGVAAGDALLFDTSEHADQVLTVDEGADAAKADAAIDDILFDLVEDVIKDAGEQRQPRKQQQQPVAQQVVAAAMPAAVEQAVIASASATSKMSNMAAGSLLAGTPATAVAPAAGAARISMLSPSNQLLAQAGDKHALDRLLQQQQRQQLSQLGQQAGTAGVRMPDAELAALKQAALPAGAAGPARLQGLPAASGAIQQKLQGLDMQRQQQLLLVQAQHQQLLAQQKQQKLLAEQRQQQQLLAAQQKLLAQQQQQQAAQQQQDLREQLAHLQQQQPLQLQVQQQQAVQSPAQPVSGNHQALLTCAALIPSASSPLTTVSALVAATKALPGDFEVQGQPLQQSANDACLGPTDAIIALQQQVAQQQQQQQQQNQELPCAAATAQPVSKSGPEQQAAQVKPAAAENGLGALALQLGGGLFSLSDTGGRAEEFNPWAVSLIDPSVVMNTIKPQGVAPAADQGLDKQQRQTTSQQQQQQQPPQQQVNEMSKQVTRQQETDILSALMPELAALGLTPEQQLQVLKQMLGMKQQQQAKQQPVNDVQAMAQQHNEVSLQQQPQVQPPRQPQQPQHLWLQQMAAGQSGNATAKPDEDRLVAAAQGSSAQQQPQQQSPTSEDQATIGTAAAGDNKGEPASEDEEFDASMLPVDLFDFLDGHNSPKRPLLDSQEDILGLAGSATDTWQPQQQPAERAAAKLDKYKPPSLRRSSGGGGADVGSWAPGQPRTRSSSNGARSIGPHSSQQSSALTAGPSAGAYQHPNARARAASPPPTSFPGMHGPPGWRTTPEQEQRILAQQQLLPPHLRIVPQEAAPTRPDERQQQPPSPGHQQHEQGARDDSSVSVDDGQSKVSHLFMQAAAVAATGNQHCAGAAMQLPSSAAAHSPSCRPPGFENSHPINTENVDHEGCYNAPVHGHDGWDQVWHGQHDSRGPASDHNFWEDQHQQNEQQHEQHDGWINLDMDEVRPGTRGRDKGRHDRCGRQLDGRGRCHIDVEQKQWQEPELITGRHGRSQCRPELDSWSGYVGGSRVEQDAACGAWRQQQEEEQCEPAAFGSSRRAAPGKRWSQSPDYGTHEAPGCEAAGFDSSGFMSYDAWQADEDAMFHRARRGRMPAGNGKSHPYQQQQQQSSAHSRNRQQLHAADMEQQSAMEGSTYSTKPDSNKRSHPGSRGAGRGEASAAVAAAAAAAAMGVRGSNKRGAREEPALDLTWQQQELLGDYNSAAAPTAGPRSKPAAAAAGDAECHIKEPYEGVPNHHEQQRSPVDARRGVGHVPEPVALAPQPSQHLHSAAQGRATAGDSEHRATSSSSTSAAGRGRNYADFLKQLKTRQQAQVQQSQDNWLPGSSSCRGPVLPDAMAAAIDDGASGRYTGEPIQSPSAAASNAKDAVASAAAAAMAAVQGLKPFCTVAPPRTGKAPKKQSSAQNVTSPSSRMQGTPYAPLSNQLPSVEETKAAVMAALGSGPTVSRTDSGSSSTFRHDILLSRQDNGALWRGVDAPGGPESSGGSVSGGDAVGAVPRRGGGSGSLFSSVIGQLRKQATTGGRSDSGGDGEGFEVYATSPPDTDQSLRPYQRTHAPSYASAVAHSAACTAAPSYLAAASTGSSQRGGSGGDSSAADMVLAAIQTTRQRAHVHSQRTHAKTGSNGRCQQAHDNAGKADAAWREDDTWNAQSRDV